MREGPVASPAETNQEVAFEEGGDVPESARVSELAARFDNEFVMDWVPELERSYGVGDLHGGGR